MIRISLSSLALAAILALGAATPAASETLKNNNQPTACDCSNCSAEQCQGNGSSYSAIAFVGGWGASSAPAGTGFTTQQSGANAGTESLHYRITLRD